MQAFKEIFETHYSSLCNYASAIVKDPMKAEDLVQDLFLQLWEKDKLKDVQQMDRFLLRSTKFKCIDYLRSNKITNELSLAEADTRTQTQPTDILEEDIEPLLHYFAAKLPPKTKEVFLLSRTSQLTYKEIADQMGISIKTVEGQMGRALRQMRQFLIQHDFLSLLFFL